MWAAIDVNKNGFVSLAEISRVEIIVLIILIRWGFPTGSERCHPGGQDRQEWRQRDTF